MIAREALAVGGVEKVVLLGESQGACVALDAALTYPVDVGGVFASYGQVYSATPVSKARSSLRVGAFIGAGDVTIGPQLALASYGRMISSGLTRFRLRVEALFAHVQVRAPGCEIVCDVVFVAMLLCLFELEFVMHE